MRREPFWFRWGFSLEDAFAGLSVNMMGGVIIKDGIWLHGRERNRHLDRFEGQEGCKGQEGKAMDSVLFNRQSLLPRYVCNSAARLALCSVAGNFGEHVILGGFHFLRRY